jgi:hypothetical protein
MAFLPVIHPYVQWKIPDLEYKYIQVRKGGTVKAHEEMDGRGICALFPSVLL